MDQSGDGAVVGGPSTSPFKGLSLSVDAYTLDTAGGKRRLRTVKDDGSLEYETPYVDLGYYHLSSGSQLTTVYLHETSALQQSSASGMKFRVNSTMSTRLRCATLILTRSGVENSMWRRRRENSCQKMTWQSFAEMWS